MGRLKFVPVTSASASPSSSHSRPPGPRYFQVKLAVQDRIAGLEPGQSLPPERKLADELGTSRTTLRKALAELTAEGVLSSTQGSGNYVSPPKPVHVRQLTSFSEDLADEGLSVESAVLSAELVPADADVAGHLGVEAGEPVFALTRLRVVEGEPFALETAHLPSRFDDLAARVERSGSLYATLRDDFGVRISDVADTVQTALAVPAQAELLHVPTGAPLLVVHRLSRDAGGAVVEWTCSHYRGDRARFVALGRIG